MEEAPVPQSTGRWGSRAMILVALVAGILIGANIEVDELWQSSHDTVEGTATITQQHLRNSSRASPPPPNPTVTAGPTPTSAPVPTRLPKVHGLTPIPFAPHNLGVDHPVRQLKVGTWRVVSPASAVTALAQEPGRIDWEKVCAGTASATITGSPRLNSTSESVAGGTVFQGDTVELFRQQRAGLCVLLLHHASLVDARGVALPTAHIPVGGREYYMPRGDPFKKPNYGKVWEASRAHNKGTTIVGKTYVPYTYRSRSSITVVRDAVLWDRALTFSKAASFGGGGCQSWKLVRDKVLVSHAKYDKDTGSVKLDGSLDIPHVNGTVLHMPQLFTGFYHWTIEYLPRLWVAKQILEQDPTIRLSIDGWKSSFAIQSLQLLNISRPMQRRDRYTADWAVVPSVAVCDLVHAIPPETYTAAMFMLGTSLLKGEAEGSPPPARLQEWVEAAVDPRDLWPNGTTLPLYNSSEVPPPPGTVWPLPQGAAWPLPNGTLWPEPPGRVWPLPPPDQMENVSWVDVGDESAMADWLMPSVPAPAMARYLETKDQVPDPHADLTAFALPETDTPRTAAVQALDAAVDGGKPIVVLIHRRKGHRRWLENEPEVRRAIVAALPWARVVVFNEARMGDAAVLFRAAALVVGPHGAGLSNLIFSRPGTPMIEILSARKPGSYQTKNPGAYMDLSGGFGHPYFPLVCHSNKDAMSATGQQVTRLLHKAWPMSWWHTRDSPKG